MLPDYEKNCQTEYLAGDESKLIFNNTGYEKLFNAR